MLLLDSNLLSFLNLLFLDKLFDHVLSQSQEFYVESNKKKTIEMLY
jgi:hypothetical protein